MAAGASHLPEKFRTTFGVTGRFISGSWKIPVFQSLP